MPQWRVPRSKCPPTSSGSRWASRWSTISSTTSCRPWGDVSRHVVCVDVGSTFTKAALVDAEHGALVATAASATTSGTDVMEGIEACRTELGVTSDVATLACSSAGGGLRLAVVGYERVVTAEAGHRGGLSAGGPGVHVAPGELTPVGVAELRASRPDVVLLVGGTDGGNADVLCHNARRLAIGRVPVP